MISYLFYVVENIENEQQKLKDSDDEQETQDSKEALKQLKQIFKKKGGAAELRALCEQFGMKYSDKDKTLKAMAYNSEIRYLLVQQGVIHM